MEEEFYEDDEEDYEFLKRKRKRKNICKISKDRIKRIYGACDCYTNY